MTQKWKKDSSLHSCPRKEKEGQENKCLDYDKVYIDEFLNQDPMRDWESVTRCQDLLKFCLHKISKLTDKELADMSILDCGSKDGQTVAYCRDTLGMDATGMEISEPYVKWANERGRTTVQGDMCNMPAEFENKFDVTFAHHVLGLTRDYFKALTEMFKATKAGGRMIVLNDVPGNPRKHYSYIESPEVYTKWLKREELNPHKLVYFNSNPHMPDTNEWILYIKKG